MKALSFTRAKMQVSIRRFDRLYWTRIAPMFWAWRGIPEDLQVVSLSSFADFQQHAAGMDGPWKEHRRQEQALARTTPIFHVRGYCFPCRGWRRFSVTWAFSSSINGVLTPNWREHLACPTCGLNNRMRAVLHLLAREVRVGQQSQIYITEHSTRLFRWIRAHFPHTVGSNFLGDAVPLGQVNEAGIRNEDLTRLAFANAQFDCVLCFEVFEHVPNFRQAFLECARILTSGGCMLFSAPFDPAEETNTIRARLQADGGIEHLLAPEYHGDPLNEAGILAFQHFGWEMVTQIREAGSRECRLFCTIPGTSVI